MLKGIFVSSYKFEYGMAGCSSGSLDVALKLVDDHHFPFSSRASPTEPEKDLSKDLSMNN